MTSRFCLEVAGPYACFTRPEMKVERVSYDVITPSAARAVFESILWKPAIRWRVTQIEVLRPIRFINLRRNEVSAVVSKRNVQQAMHAGSGNLALYIEDEPSNAPATSCAMWPTAYMPNSHWHRAAPSP